MMIAAYCRVSTEREDQRNSFESQCAYFSEYIQNHPDWELYKIYADEGLSGTATERRTQFKNMISDAVEHRFQLILTKEVSRFSRNILDAIYYTRELKKHGVSVLFMNDGINTSEADSELRLSIMGSLAQEESRKTSSRVKWGQQRRMEQGVVFGRSMLGYDVQNGKIYVNPDGASLVREIYENYTIKKMSSNDISKILSKRGIEISASQLIKILHNEKYAGDLIQKKTYTPDYLTHKKKYNHGQEDLVVIRNHHEAIIARDLWEKTQTEISSRAKRKSDGSHYKKHMFSGVLSCGLCERRLIARTKTLKSGEALYWRCSNDRCTLGRCIRNENVCYMLENAVRSLGVQEISALDISQSSKLLDSFHLNPDNAVLKLRYLPHEWVFKI